MWQVLQSKSKESFKYPKDQLKVTHGAEEGDERNKEEKGNKK